MDFHVCIQCMYSYRLLDSRKNYLQVTKFLKTIKPDEDSEENDSNEGSKEAKSEKNSKESFRCFKDLELIMINL